MPLGEIDTAEPMRQTPISDGTSSVESQRYGPKTRHLGVRSPGETTELGTAWYRPVPPQRTQGLRLLQSAARTFDADRRMATQAIRLWPELPIMMQANRDFMRRAVRHLASEGITQVGYPFHCHQHQWL